VLKDAALPAVVVARLESPKAGLALPIKKPSTIIVAEENTCYTKFVMVEDKGKGPTKTEEGKKLLFVLVPGQPRDQCCYMADNIGFMNLEAMLSTMSFEDFSDRLAYTHLKVIVIDFLLYFVLNCFKN
jgi:hypothetical protein